MTSKQPAKLTWTLIIGIMFLPFIFCWFTLRKGYSRKHRVGAFAWLSFFILNAIFKAAIERKDPDVHYVEAKITKTKRVTEKKESVIQESCELVARSFSSNSSLSKVQQEKLWPKYEDRKFKWKLRVMEVSERMIMSGYKVQYKCAVSNSLIQDIVITYPEKNEDLVLKLQKGSYYEVQGRLTGYSPLLGLEGRTLEE